MGKKAHPYLLLEEMMEGRRHGGRHINGFKYRNRRQVNPGHSIINSILTTALGFVINDISKEDSKIKLLTSKLFSSKQIPKNNKKPIDVDYKVISEEENK